MSYCSRVYRHRNTHSPEEMQQQQPFFSKKHDVNKSSEKSAFFQAKLSVNQPGDSYEKEADAMAHAVVNRSSQPSGIQQKKIGGIQRLSTDKEEEKLGTNDARMKRDKDIQEKPMEQSGMEKEKMKGLQRMHMPNEEEKKGVQRKCAECEKEEQVQKSESATAAHAPAADAAAPSSKTSSRIENSAGKGISLPKNTLHEMNALFGLDFSGVRIHKDTEAAGLTRELQAQAFTYGNDIYFNEGKFDPNSSLGKFLLAHELTHVIQQGMADEDKVQKSPALVAGIGAAVLAAVGCSFLFYNYALDNYSSKSDKWKHCWVACKIASYCGGDAVAIILGAGKEVVDAICDYYGYKCSAEFLDFVADLEGAACSHVPALPCTTCCDNTAAYL